MLTSRHPPLLEARAVTNRYRGGLLANERVDLTAELGEVIALIGPNGAGKTTFVLQLVGLLAPTAGSIRVAGIDVVIDPDAVKPLIGYQPQGHMAMGGVEVGHVLRFTARLRGLSKAEATRQAAALSEEFQLHDVLARQLNKLSGGWRRLVDVAVAFAGAPKLVVLDEPTENLDPTHRRLIWDRLDALRASRAQTCLLVTHNLLEAERVVDRVAIIDRGRLIRDGSPGTLKQHFGSDLLLDVHLHAGATAPKPLLQLGKVHHVRSGHVQILLGQSHVPAATTILLGDGARAWLDDFRLAPPSLEAIYLGLGEGLADARPAA